MIHNIDQQRRIEQRMATRGEAVQLKVPFKKKGGGRSIQEWGIPQVRGQRPE